MNQRKRTTKLGTRLTTFKKATGKIGTGASKVAKNKKQSESADKDTADEMWDEDEKQIHEEEMAAKKAAEALHESNSGDDATKKGEKTAVKIKRERTESASEQDTQSKSTKSDLQKRVPNSSLNLTCVHCKSKCQTSMVSIHFVFKRFTNACSILSIYLVNYAVGIQSSFGWSRTQGSNEQNFSQAKATIAKDASRTTGCSKGSR